MPFTIIRYLARRRSVFVAETFFNAAARAINRWRPYRADAGFRSRSIEKFYSMRGREEEGGLPATPRKWGHHATTWSTTFAPQPFWSMRRRGQLEA